MIHVQTLRKFSENGLFDRKSTGADLTKNGENVVLSQNGRRKYFFGKISCSTEQNKRFYSIFVNFCKIEFSTENRQAHTLKKW